MKEGDRYRHVRTGAIGKAVLVDSEWFVEYLRGSNWLKTRLDEEAWVQLKDEKPPMADATRAMIAFAADVAMLTATGQYGRRKIWESLNRGRQKEWQDPDNPPIPEFLPGFDGEPVSQADRRRLYRFVHRGLMPPKKRGGDGDH